MLLDDMTVGVVVAPGKLVGLLSRSVPAVVGMMGSACMTCLPVVLFQSVVVVVVTVTAVLGCLTLATLPHCLVDMTVFYPDQLVVLPKNQSP